ncbi:MAG: polyprenyl synthetase family protein [Bryobacterales bacterium]|nr:polyprenyl synthetase family protein [Bryobacteraceae bacterium]MDW8130537.1 polyprenyl synthetase family protein [Bryobacterales bacterium]
MALGKAGRASAAGIVSLIGEDLRQVERFLQAEGEAPVEAITGIARHLYAGGGKRLRPTLLLLSSRLIGDGGASAIRLAAVVELIHTATLVHDDVIDGADTRRGQPSPNVKWGNHTSVLAGDWLYMKAFQIALREANFHVLDLLIAVTQLMVEGELIQLERLGSIEVSENDYLDLVSRKTAALFAACARLGATCAGAGGNEEERLGQYAWNLGMAFQLVDDVLDFTAAEDVLGKPVGSDLKEGKLTLPLIYALEGAAAHERELVAAVLADRSYDRVPFRAVLELAESRGGIRRALSRAEQFAEAARRIIREFPPSPYQQALSTLTTLVIEREY